MIEAVHLLAKPHSKLHLVSYGGFLIEDYVDASTSRQQAHSPGELRSSSRTLNPGMAFSLGP